MELSTQRKLSDIRADVKRATDAGAYYRECFPNQDRGNGNALCVWHPDTAPSLQCTKDSLTCYGGCATDGKPKRYDVFDIHQKRYGVDHKTAVLEIASTLGIPTEVSKPKIAAEYDYTDEGGALLYQVLRYEPKDFRQRRPNGPGKWVWSLGNARRTLYRLPQILESDTVWLCEGEKDADNLHALGLCGTTAPHGAGKMKTLIAKWGIDEPLTGKTVYIVPDNDQQGKEHALQVAECLYERAECLKILPLPGLAEKEDVSDFIRIHGEEEARRQLLHLAENTPEYEPPKLYVFGSTSFHDVATADIPPPNWIIPDILPEGVCLLCGKAKLGKSWLVLGWCIDVSRGGLALSNFKCQARDSLYLALEDTARRLKKRLNLVLEGEPAPQNAYIETTAPLLEEPKNNPNLLDVLRQWLSDHPNAGLVVIDTLAKVAPGKGQKENMYTSDYKQISGLQRLAGEFGVAIVIVHHENKREGGDILDMVSGSTGLTGSADTIMNLKRASRAEADGTLSITGRDVPDTVGAVKFNRDTGSWRWMGTAIEVKMTDERLKIRDAIKQMGKPLSPSEIGELTGQKRSAVHNLCKKMVDKGELVKSANPGKYTLPPEDDLYSEPWKKGYESQPVQEEAYLDEM